MKSHTQNSISPAQLLLLLYFQLLLLPQLMQLTQLQILHFLEDTKVSKTILMLLLIPKMLQKFTGIDCSSMQVGGIKTYQAHKIAPKISNTHKNFDLYQVFMHNFHTRMSQCSSHYIYIYCLQEESNYFGLSELIHFGLELTR